MARYGNRPVSTHILAFLEQNVGVAFNNKTLVKKLAQQGWHHTGHAVLDNCRLLIQQGKIMKIEKTYGIQIKPIIKIPEIILPKPPRKYKLRVEHPKPKPKPQKPKQERQPQAFDKPKKNILQFAKEWEEFDGTYNEFLKAMR